jgi:hypothetical protein
MGQHASSYTINDVDTHVTEDPGVFVDRVPAAMRDRVPYVKADRRGRDTWFLGDQRMGAAGLSATMPRPVWSTWTRQASGPW